MVKSPKATKVVLNKTQHTATVEDMFTLTANVMPEKAEQKVTWSIDKNDFLQDLGEGKFKALKAGEVVITATAQDGSGVKAECRVTVKEKKPEIPKATQVILNMKLAFIHVEDVLKLTASVFPEKANQKVSWQLSNSMVLESLGEGNFKAVREGRVTILALAQDGSGAKAECHVTVTKKKQEPKIPKATEIVLDSVERNVHLEDVFTLTAKVMPEKAIQKVVWKMDKTDILQDLGEGRFKALKAGEVTITATVQDGSGLKAECKVKVNPPTSLAQITTDGHHTLHWEGNTLVLRGIKPDTSVRLHSLQGKTLQQHIATDTEIRIPIGFLQGVFILDTSDGFRVKVIR